MAPTATQQKVLAAVRAAIARDLPCAVQHAPSAAVALALADIYRLVARDEALRTLLRTRVILLDWTLAEHALLDYSSADDCLVLQELKELARVLDADTTAEHAERARAHFDCHMPAISRLTRAYERVKMNARECVEAE